TPNQRLRGFSPYALIASTGGNSVVATHGGNNEAEEHSLQQASEDILEHKNLPGGTPVLMRVYAKHQGGNYATSDQPHEIGNDSQKKEHKHSRDHSRRDQLLCRIGTQGAHGINLFGHDH